MSRRLTTAALAFGLTLGCLVPAYAQEAQSPAPKPPAEAAPPTARPEPTGQPVNIKLDITITDQTGPGEPLRKVVTLIVADRGIGSIRSTGSVRTQGRVQINVDARPTIVQSGAIRLTMGLEYNPRTLGNDAPTEWSSLNEQLGVVLEPGKPLVVSQAADPASDRKITVELRATILK
jgi:hypothetical protein